MKAMERFTVAEKRWLLVGIALHKIVHPAICQALRNEAGFTAPYGCLDISSAIDKLNNNKAFAIDLQEAATKVRSKVRNKWAHSVMNEWIDKEHFHTCFLAMRKVIDLLPYPSPAVRERTSMRLRKYEEGDATEYNTVYSVSPEVPARPRVGSPDGRRPEGDPIRGRAGTEAVQAVRAKRVRIVLWNIWKPRAVRGKNPRAVPVVITRAGTPVSNVIAAQEISYSILIISFLVETVTARLLWLCLSPPQSAVSCAATPVTSTPQPAVSHVVTPGAYTLPIPPMTTPQTTMVAAQLNRARGHQSGKFLGYTSQAEPY
ncbi:hypothetical protein Bbelb_068840 [Branchiostoma belcheri]|nr:hypothetical protein Bbelb_068840 [Branchiostoma belcheri]